MMISEDMKPDTGPRFWSLEVMSRWLRDELPADYFTEKSTREQKLFCGTIEKEERVHVKIDSHTFAAEEEKLFSTEALAFSDDLSFLVSIETSDNKVLDTLNTLNITHPMGGEHRLAHFKALPAAELLHPPQDIITALSNAQSLRMILATPAPFAQGWLPGWLDAKTLTGTPPGLEESGLVLKLKGACVERWKPLSGWSLEKLKSTGKPGPKPVKRLVPAGSVYFFQVQSGQASQVADIWLKSIMEEPQARRDGFGLALWGLWQKDKKGA
jgi:CRISPR-associated protein Cmr3